MEDPCVYIRAGWRGVLSIACAVAAGEFQVFRGEFGANVLVGALEAEWDALSKADG